MNFITFEQLPTAVTQIYNKLQQIEQLLVAKNNTTHQEKNELLSVKETANFLKIKVATVYGLISKRSIPCMKVTKRVYFLKEDLIYYLQQGKKKTVSEIEAETDAYLSKTKRKGGGRG